MVEFFIAAAQALSLAALIYVYVQRFLLVN